MNQHKVKKLEQLKTMLDNKEITQKLYDEAVRLEKDYSPYIFKKNAKGKITGITDIFSDMKKERKAKDAKKNKRKKKAE